MRVDITNDSDYEIAYVDADDVDALMEAIAYMTTLKSDITPHKLFEAEYRTKAGLRVMTFDNDDGTIDAGASGGPTETARVFLDLDQLKKFSDMLVKAKSQF